MNMFVQSGGAPLSFIGTNDSKFVKYEGGNKTFYPGKPTVEESFSCFTPVA